jgi:uroporphyrinogen-III synthase
MTAAALAAQGIPVEFVPTLASQEGLLAEFPRPVGRALFVGGERARRLLVDELPADFRPVYRTVELRPAPPDGDVVLVASPSAAAAWGKLGSALPTITIGPQTTAAAYEAGLPVVAEAQTQDVAGLVNSAAAWRASLRS